MQNVSEKRKKRETGITLIALVITIIVLLILAAVSIATLTGENGILTQANDAKTETAKATAKEKVEVEVAGSYGANGYLDNELLENNLKNITGITELPSPIKDSDFPITVNVNNYYVKIEIDGTVKDGINWKEAFETATAPKSQKEERNDGVIGIGTDGNPVNMDLWEYTLMEDGTYLLNDGEAIKEDGTRTSGYDNSNLIEGKIQGTIPQYIKGKTDENFIEVTSINYLFYNTNIKQAPVIPDTVTSMRATFNTCLKLKEAPLIPNKVTNMYGTFAGSTAIENAPTIPRAVINMGGTFLGCTNLKTVPNIGSNVTNMRLTFANCTSLEIAPKIPNGVVNMYDTFKNCKNLKQVSTIPSSVTILCATFKGCSKLQGTLEINANVTGRNLEDEYYNNIDYMNCLLEASTDEGCKLKVTGSCKVLNEIVKNANNTNITL